MKSVNFVFRNTESQKKVETLISNVSRNYFGHQRTEVRILLSNVIKQVQQNLRFIPNS